MTLSCVVKNGLVARHERQVKCARRRNQDAIRRIGDAASPAETTHRSELPEERASTLTPAVAITSPKMAIGDLDVRQSTPGA